MARATLALLVALPAAAAAQVDNGFDGTDPHIQSIAYRAGQVTTIAAEPGFAVMLDLAPDEQVATIALGNSAAWSAHANHAGNRVFVQAQAGAPDTNMTILTNARTYIVHLVAAMSGDAPYEVRFTYPREAPALLTADGAVPGVVGHYRLHGDRTLRPTRMSDDGSKTYIFWPPNVALPAVFYIDDHGRELIANGNMRDGVYVLDAIHARVLFRIDRRRATADRFVPRGAH